MKSDFDGTLSVISIHFCFNSLDGLKSHLEKCVNTNLGGGVERDSAE